MKSEIEVPEIKDVDEIVELWVELAKEQKDYGSLVRAEENSALIRDTFSRHINDNTLFAAVSEGTVIGFVNFELEHRLYRLDVTRGFVHNLYVKPQFRNAGVGTSLLERAETELRKRGAERIVLEVLSKNGRANDFYRRRGYTAHRIEFMK